MPESNLALEYTQIAGRLGDFLGYGWGAEFDDTTWTAAQVRNIDTVIESAQRIVYTPPLLPGETTSHSWTFLRPVAELSLASGVTGLDMPADFTGEVEGVIQMSADSTVMWHDLTHTNWSHVRRLRSDYPDRTGKPEMVAIEAQKGTTGNRGQRWRMEVFPETDQAYTVRMAYKVSASAMTAQRPFPYGGADHAELFLAAAIAAGELFKDDAGKGPRWAYFMERLAASIAQDRKNKPQLLGYNGDRSDLRHVGSRDWRSRVGWNWPVVTVNGVTPS